ncbi:MAG: Asp-tRNA(Asn)/Glu-tRNA(Gln) amidotransferase GatCAB subunit B, partial [Oscillospiraceae bacterium]|nr:Asp-tRNA(Asn)/Glu-tRNA(Gln) amidotransferase GatCAB subunit B [Oscillospiraceae bacterium]
NEGSLRCDVNLSVRKKGEQALGTRTEMKNLNSFQYVGKAIEYEFERQVKAVESEEEIVQETRRFDPSTGKTYSMRRKENADDYRYFPDPDLAPIEVTAKALELLKGEIPTLPDVRKAQYIERWGISAYGAEQLVSVRAVADYFEAVAAQTAYPQLAANIILSDVMRLLPQDETCVPIAGVHMAQLATLTGDGVINSSTCKQLVQQMWEKDATPAVLIEQQGLAQISDDSVLLPLVMQVLKENTAAVQDYKKGKTNALQALVGQVMRITKGRANPVKINCLVAEKLKETE